MFEAQLRSDPTEIGRMILERTRSWLTMRNTGSGQSLQCLRKKKKNGRQVSKNASQLDTTTATELAKAFSSGIRNSSSSLIPRARNFFLGAAPSVAMAGHSDMLSPLKKGGALVSTRSLKRRRHVEDGSLASLKSGPKQINADHEDLALAA